MCKAIFFLPSHFILLFPVLFHLPLSLSLSSLVCHEVSWSKGRCPPYLAVRATERFDPSLHLLQHFRKQALRLAWAAGQSQPYLQGWLMSGPSGMGVVWVAN